MKFTILLESEDDSSAPLLVAEIERTGPLNAAGLHPMRVEIRRGFAPGSQRNLQGWRILS